MKWLRGVLTGCLFGHDEPVKEIRKRQLVFVCPRCQADLGVILPRQKFRARAAAKPLRLVRLRKQA